jgi:hypothetical protein
MSKIIGVSLRFQIDETITIAKPGYTHLGSYIADFR